MPRGSPLLTEMERRRFGEFLRLLRGDRSKRDVAAALAGENVDKVDVNRGRITGYESGVVLPTVATTRKLAAIYGVSTLRLLHMAGHAVELLRPIVMLLETGRAQNIPIFSQTGALFALYAFPRRGDITNLVAVSAETDLDTTFSKMIQFAQPRGKLPHFIGLATAALRDPALPSDARRNIAAEYVHAYVRSTEPKLYERALQSIYPQEKEV